jgi:WD40 repeat protein/tetratricopeptide (TPR) repeat protein
LDREDLMSYSTHRSAVVLALAEEFLARYRRGERPPLREYTESHPELASEIRVVFRIMATMEQIALADETLADDVTGEVVACAVEPREQLGDYRIVREIGRGGMGVVYEAEQVSLGRLVALKLLLSQTLPTARHRRRFEREAHAAAALQHTNIVPVFGVGEHEGTPYYAMQLIPGRGLDAVLNELKTNGDGVAHWQDAARIGVQVARALEYAHGRGILHRDIKPSNLLLDGRGTVWITDFGLAKASDQHDLTHTGDLVGTLRYMPPEAFEGNFDARGDIYALGLTLYELLALRPAFGGTDRGGLIRQVTEGRAERLGQLQPEIPRDLETVVHKAMAREPVERYQSAGALADDLTRFLDGLPIQARPMAPAERAWRWCRRNPWLAGALGAAAAALVAVAIVSLTHAAQQATAKQRIGGLATDLRVSQEVSQRCRVALHQERARAHFERGHAACERGEMGMGLLYLVESWRAAALSGDTDLVHAARAGLSAWQHQAPRIVRQFPHASHASVRCVAFSPDGTIVATAGTDSTAQLWDAAIGRQMTSPLTHSSAVTKVVFSRDGKAVLTAAGGKARLWNTATGRPLGPSLPHHATDSDLALGPDGKTALTMINDYTARLWDTATGQGIGAPLTHRGRINAVAFSPDAKVVLTASADGTVRLWDVATGQPVGPIFMHRANSVAFSPDGTNVLTGGHDHRARLWNARTGRPVGPPLVHEAAVDAVAFSPEGKTIVTGSSDNTARLWDAATGSSIGAPLTHKGPVFTVVFGSDGKIVLTASQDGTARLWDAASGRPMASAVPVQGMAGCVALGPEGTTVLAVVGDGTARLWDVTGTVRCGLPLIHAAPVHDAAFSPDGKTVLTGSADGMARLWDAATGNPVGVPMRHQQAVSVVAFSPGGKSVLTGSADGTARLWDATTGQLLAAFWGHRQIVRAVAFSPDGKTILTGSADGTARLWDAVTGRRMGAPLRPRAAVTWVAFDADGKRALTAGADGAARRWDTTTGQQIGSPWTHRGAVAGDAYSPDGKTLLAASADNTARLRDVATGRPLGPPLPHRAPVNKLEMSPDGRTALTATGGNEVLLWDVAELPDDLPRLENWVRASTGLVREEQGELRHLGGEASQANRDRLRCCGGPKPRWRLDPVLFGQEPTDRARAWARRHDWAAAEAAYTEAALARPLDPAIPLERARFHAARSQPAEAEADCARSYALGNRDAMLVDAIVASQSLFTRVVAESPDSAAPLWAKRGALRLAQGRWDDAAADFARELDLMPMDRRWQSPRNRRALALARWDHAYARLLELRPDDGPLWSARGRYHAQRGRWDQAAADFARGITPMAPDSEECIEYACLQLLVGDDQGYRAFLREVQCRAGRIDDPYVAYVLARAAVVAPAPVVEPGRVTRWAERAVASSLNGWNLHTLGVAHYRAGHLDAAIRWLEESNATDWGEQGRMQNRLVLAMAHHRLGHAAQARALLDEVARWWKALEAARTDGAVTMPLTDWLPLQLFRREAETLIVE